MYTITHEEGDPVQWRNATVPLKSAFGTTENTKNILIQFSYIATGEDTFSCYFGCGVDGFMLCNHAA